MNDKLIPFKDEGFILGANDKSHGDIKFYVKDCEEIVRLAENGNIYVKGKLIVNDMELVDGLREWLTRIRYEYRGEG